MKVFVKSRVSWKALLRWLSLALCGVLIGINIYLANANRLVGNQLPMPFGYGAAVVLSGSMEPHLSKGDLIFVSEAETYSEKDVVVFQDGNSLVVHRIIQITETQAITQGDANNTPDDPIQLSDIKGKVIFSIPYVGTAVNLLKTPVGTVCVLILAVLLLEIPRRREKKKDDEDRQKIIDEINRLRNKD